MRRSYRMPVSNVAYSNVVAQSNCGRMLLSEQQDGPEAPKNYIGFRSTAPDGSGLGDTIVYAPGQSIEILCPQGNASRGMTPGTIVGQVITIAGATNQFPSASNLDQQEF